MKLFISLALVCCAKVTSLTVEDNESGLTNYVYTKEWIRYFVTPAGYIGSSVIGCALLISSKFSDFLFDIDLKITIQFVELLVTHFVEN
jgi:hypothetical protein